MDEPLLLLVVVRGDGRHCQLGLHLYLSLLAAGLTAVMEHHWAGYNANEGRTVPRVAPDDCTIVVL